MYTTILLSFIGFPMSYLIISFVQGKHDQLMHISDWCLISELAVVVSCGRILWKTLFMTFPLVSFFKFVFDFLGWVWVTVSPFTKNCWVLTN